jgi:arylsulfatase A-like enzyme
MLPSCRPPVQGNGRNLLLITLETTRADHLGAYGYRRDTTPRIDALAREGVLFESFLTVSPRTNPSLASMMTSRYPHEHGVRNLLLTLEPGNRTLAEVLRDAGYVTAAVQTHPRLISPSGLAQGFDDYDADYSAHPRAAEACAAAEEWIRDASRGRRPWFLWLHLMDPHWTYDPPAGWSSRFAPQDPRPAQLYRALREHRLTIGSVVFRNAMPPDEIEAFIDHYDAEIAFTDHAVGDLLDVLDDLGQRDRTVVVLTADHGEAFGEQNYYFEHGDLGTEAEIHVPLILSAPGLLPAGVRAPWTASSIDLAPTVLDLLRLPPEEHFRGSSLVAWVEQGAGTDRACFGEVDKRMHEENDRREVDGVAGKWRWIRRGDFKLVHRPRASGPPERALYALAQDPTESRDVAALYPETVAELGAELDAWLAEDDGTEREYHITDEAREQLRALGYIN